MKVLFYDETELARQLEAAGPSIFLAGPTASGCWTQWRIEALELLGDRGFSGAVVVPEFRDRSFDEAAPIRFARSDSPAPGMRPTSYDILEWETTGIEGSTCVLFWMPFAIAAEGDPGSLPGFTTRAEVSRELVRAPERIVLGMSPGAFSSSHIRYHAHRGGVTIHETLSATVDAALAYLSARP